MCNNISKITELSCWAKGIIVVVMSFVFFGTCLHYSFRLTKVQLSINYGCYDLKKQWETSKIHVGYAFNKPVF